MKKSLWGPLMATALNILLVYILWFVCRIEFFLLNKPLFAGVESAGDFMRIALAATRFDTPGILYLNLLYVLLMLLPLHLKERRGYYRVCKWIFVGINSIGIVANLADSVYFPYTLRRTTWDVTQEFSHESNLGAIVATEMAHNWWLVLLAGALIAALIWCYSSPVALSGKGERAGAGEGRRLPAALMAPRWQYYTVMTASLAIAAAICVGGVRGGWLNHWWCYLLALPLLYLGWRLRRRSKAAAIGSATIGLALLCVAPIGGWRHRDIRPIALSNANAYAKHPSDVALILNTPFSIIRTLKENPFPIPGYFTDPAEMAAVYSPLHTPTDSLAAMDKRNVVVLILESFGEEYIDALNDRALGKDSPGFAPFMDSLVAKSVHFRYSYDNGNKSIDAMPSILASIPKFAHSFILTPAAMGAIPGLPALLKEQGYATAFFHGARTGSMGFDGFARSVGFDSYYGREDYEADPRFGGAKEFDGYWAIWDEPFLQYYAAKMAEMPQPFMTALFTASSHHPFRVPEKYEGKFPKGTLPIHQTIGYTDHALQEFFAAARRQPWYENTLFVITNDHTNERAYDEYRSEIGAYYGPILLYDPSGRLLEPGEREGIMSQIDVMPTVLGLLGYPKEYAAFGTDLSVAIRASQSEKSSIANPSARSDLSGITASTLSPAAASTLSAAAPSGATMDMPGSAVSYINNIYQYVAEGYILRFDGEKSIGLFAIDDHLLARNLLAERPEEAARLERRLKALLQTYMTRYHR